MCRSLALTILSVEAVIPPTPLLGRVDEDLDGIGPSAGHPFAIKPGLGSSSCRMPDLLVIALGGKESDQLTEPIAGIRHENPRREPMLKRISAALAALPNHQLDQLSLSPRLL